MSDHEHEFTEKGDSGASMTYPQQAGTVKKGGFAMLKDKPCKVTETSTSKTGKHGHAKIHFTGVNIFTNAKVEDVLPTSHNIDVPVVKRVNYVVASLEDDGYLSVMGEGGVFRSDLSVKTDGDLFKGIKKLITEEKDCLITVQSACGEEMVMDFREGTLGM